MKRLGRSSLRPDRVLGTPRNARGPPAQWPVHRPRLTSPSPATHPRCTRPLPRTPEPHGQTTCRDAAPARQLRGQSRWPAARRALAPFRLPLWGQRIAGSFSLSRHATGWGNLRFARFLPSERFGQPDGRHPSRYRRSTTHRCVHGASLHEASGCISQTVQARLEMPSSLRRSVRRLSW